MATKEDWDLTQMGAFSHLVFGSPHRLPVAVMAAEVDPGELYAARISQLAGTDRKEAARLLRNLERARLLRKVDTPNDTARGRPPILFARVDDDAWLSLQALGDRYRRSPRRRAQQG